MSTPNVMNAIPQVDTIAMLDDKHILRQNIILDDVPDWLTKNYFQNCLQTYFNEKNLEIRNFHVVPALGKGENYGGVLWRVKVDFNNRDQLKIAQYIVKTSFEGDEFARKKMEPYDIFNREMSVYENIIPKLKRLLLEINDSEEIFANLIAVDYKHSALVLEDLSVSDFKMPNRLEGLDVKLTKIILRKLAKMHATSAVLNERENSSLEVYDRGMFNRHTDSYKSGILGLFEAGTELVGEWENFEVYAKKLRELYPMFMELGRRVFDPIKGHVNVFAHGDLWTNNILVKYDEISGEPLNVIILDFQYAVWGSPAIDLIYLFNSSLKEDMHIGQHDELIQYYYSVFSNTLRKLMYKATIPSLHRFYLQLEEKAFYAFSTTFVNLPVQRNEFTEDADFNAIMEENERAKKFKRMCYKNAYCQRIIRRMLPVFDRKGLLDINQ